MNEHALSAKLRLTITSHELLACYCTHGIDSEAVFLPARRGVRRIAVRSLPFSVLFDERHQADVSFLFLRKTKQTCSMDHGEWSPAWAARVEILESHAVL